MKKNMKRVLMMVLALMLALSAGSMPAIAEASIEAEAPAEAPATYAALEPGMSGDEVETLNATLMILGYLDGELSDEYGEETEAAVRAFQLAAGLEETGLADSNTQAALYAEDAPVNPDDPPEGEQVWIPKSGEKYHSKWNCGNMKSPSCVSVEEAVAQGYEPCGRCYKEK